MDDTNLRAAGGMLSLGDLENPNKMPFSGVLTYLGVPSDQAPGGSGGRKVLIPVEVGNSALDSLKGMPINLAASMDDHDTSSVVGVIENAWVGEADANGAVPVNVSGHIFAKSFPDEAVAIKASQSQLGFSYETAKTKLESGIHNGEAVAVANSLVFTGAAILYKKAAAYQTTSLAAKGDITLNEELLQKIIADLAELKASLADKKAVEEDVKAAEEVAVEDEEIVVEQEVPAEVEVVNAEEVVEVTAANDGIAEALAGLTDVVKALKDEVAEIKASKEAEVTAAATQAPQRISLNSTQLIAKFDKQAENGEVFASIDKQSLTTEQSMAAKLSAIYG